MKTNTKEYKVESIKYKGIKKLILSIKSLRTKHYTLNPNSILKTKNQKLQTNFGFTLVEIITTLAIVSVVAIIGFTFATNFQLTEYNSRRVADINALNGTLKTYTQIKDKLPLVAGNKQYYDESGTYSHTLSGAYGVSGFVTSEAWGKDILQTTPIDPQTKNFYGYGYVLNIKVKDGNIYTPQPQYSLATALNKQGTYYSYLKGTNAENKLLGFIKQYNGSNMVIKNSSETLPYNPYEVKLTGKILSYSGTVKVNNQIDNQTIYKDLEQDDTINISSGGLATIKLADGSEVKLGSNSQSSEIKFNTLKYTSDNNLLTQVRLFLSMGEAWVKAPDLDDGSDFTLETSNAAASVRGTVFGMTYNDTTKTGSIGVVVGKVKVNSVVNGTYQDFNNGGTHSYFQETSPATPKDENGNYIYTGSTFAIEGSDYYIVVPDGKESLKIDFYTPSPTITNTGTITPEKVEDILSTQLSLNSGDTPTLNQISRTTTGIIVNYSNLSGNYYEGSIVYMTGVNNDIKEVQIFTGLLNEENKDHLNITNQTDLPQSNGRIFLRTCYLPKYPISEDSLFGTQSLVDYSKDHFDLVSGNEPYLSGYSLQTPTKTVPTQISHLTTSTLNILKLTCTQFDSMGFGTLPFTGAILNPFPESCITYGANEKLCEPIGPDGMKLVAYAPYNSASDLSFYYSTNSLISLGYERNYILDQSFFNSNYTYPNYDYCNLSPNKGTFYYNANSCTGINGAIIPSTSGYFEELYSEDEKNQLNIISYIPNQSFFQFKDGNGGIFIDGDDSNDSGKDSLKYDIGGLGLNSSSGFAIEMSVRGAALKRSGNYFLFSFVDSANKSIFLNKTNYNGFNKIKLSYYDGSYRDIQKIDQSKLLSLIDNNFYKIQIKFNGNIWNFNIIGNGINNIESESDIDNGNSFLINSLNILNIGSQDFANSNTYNNQWNDIIDYVKIYKN